MKKDSDYISRPDGRVIARNTKGVRNFKLNFYDYIYSEAFNKIKIRLRKKYNIPINGLSFSKENIERYKKYTLIYVPKEFDNSQIKILTDLPKDIRKAIEDKIIMPYDDLWFDMLLKLFVIHEDIPSRIEEKISKEIIWPDMCKATNIFVEILSHELAMQLPFDSLFNLISAVAKQYPLAIQFTASTSQNQFTDFVTQNWNNEIKKLQSEAGQNLFLFDKRTRVSAKPYEIVRKNIDANWRIIHEKLKKAGYKDYSEQDINKMKSRERKRRQQV